MKRSMSHEAFSGKEETLTEHLNAEARKFKKANITCSLSSQGKMDFALRTSLTADTPKPFLKTHFPSFDTPVDNHSAKYSADNDISSDSGTNSTSENRINSVPSGQDCDIELLTDNGCFQTKKKLLIESSDYFRAMFTLNMAEKTKTTVYLKELDEMYLWRYLNFIGFGKIPLNACEDALEFLRFAVYLQCPSLIDACCKYLLSNLAPCNSCSVLSVFRELALNKSEQDTFKYIFENFSALNDENAKIELLTAEDLISLLHSDDLGAKSTSLNELAVLKIVLRWLLRNKEATESAQESILSNVRFALISAESILAACQDVSHELDSEVDENNNSSVSFGPVFQKHLICALSYHKEIYKQPLVQTQTTALRTSKLNRVCLDGVLAPSPIRVPEDSQWVMSKTPTHIRDPFHTVVELNGFLFILGGTRNVDVGFSNVAIRYDPRLNSFLRLSSMKDRRGDFVALPFKDRIYVFGGRNKTGGLQSCECYDISSNTWTYVADLPENLHMAAGVVVRGKMYLTGGFKENDASAATFCYDPETDTWEKLPVFMHYPRGYHVMTEGSDGHLWVIGGIDNNLTGRNVWEVESLDLDRRTWNFVGHILPGQLLLCTIRLNVFRRGSGNICISAVSSPDKYSMLEFDTKRRIWIEGSSPEPMVKLRLPSNILANQP